MERLMGKLRENRAFGKFKSFVKGQFSGSSSYLRPVTLLCCPTPTPTRVNLSQGPPLGCARIAKMDLKVKASWRSKTDCGLELSSDF